MIFTSLLVPRVLSPGSICFNICFHTHFFSTDYYGRTVLEDDLWEKTKNADSKEVLTNIAENTLQNDFGFKKAEVELESKDEAFKPDFRIKTMTIGLLCFKFRFVGSDPVNS